MKAKVLVTGGSGFIGWHLIRALMRAQLEVHVIARSQPHDLPPEVVFHAGDLLAHGEPDRLVDAVRPTILFHLAWTAQPGQFWTSPENLAWVSASLDLYRAFARAGGRRLLVTGTCAEYHWSAPRLCEKSTAINPATLYGQAKAALHRELEKASAQDGVSFAWARIFWLYGPRERAGRLVSDLFAGLRRGHLIPCSAGTQKRDFLFVEDVAAALVALLLSEVSGPVNIGAGESVAISELVKQIAELVGRPELVQFGARATPPGEPPELVADNSRLRDEVGFAPRYSLAAGLEATARWWGAMPAAN